MEILLSPDVEALVQRQLTSGKYKSALEVILAGVQLLEKQEDIYQGRLQELQQEARIGWEASQRGDVVDGATARAQIRANLRSRYGSSESCSLNFGSRNLLSKTSNKLQTTWPAN
jgi:antitoxin ParD1/3/4